MCQQVYGCRSCDEESAESASLSKTLLNILKVKKLPHYIFIQNICSKYSSKYSFKIFGEYLRGLNNFLVAEAVMRKRNELEKLKMLRQDEERRREELVGEKKNQKNEEKKTRKTKKT